MTDLTPIALVTFLLALGGARLWARRCLRFLSVEQKALVLDASSQSSIWLPIGLALFAAVILWLRCRGRRSPPIIGLAPSHPMRLSLAAFRRDQRSRSNSPVSPCAPSVVSPRSSAGCDPLSRCPSVSDLCGRS